MKNSLIIITLTLCCAFNFNAYLAHGGDRGQFETTKSGEVTIDGNKFKNIYDYIRSDYFKETGKRCGTKKRFIKDRILASTSDCTLSKTVIQNEYWPDNSYIIPVVFHVIYKTDGTGNISDQRIYDQVEVLNEDFRAISGTLGELGFDTKIQFKLVEITRTINDQWHLDSDELGYKQTLGWGQNHYLNVYVNSASGYLGYAYLPQEEAGSVLDGITVLYETVGGRDNGFSPYDQGRTLVHEIGHYLGLYHTFESCGCYEGYEAGDLIMDTNSESMAHYGCPETSTCTTLDPVHNYMNYTDDICMTNFTTEQGNRAVCTIVNYRPLIFLLNTVSKKGLLPALNLLLLNAD